MVRTEKDNVREREAAEALLGAMKELEFRGIDLEKLPVGWTDDEIIAAANHPTSPHGLLATKYRRW